MDDEAIRALVAGPPAKFGVTTDPPGMRVVWRSQVEEADADYGAVKRWVERLGGNEGIQIQQSSRSLGARYGTGGGPVEYLAIPREALTSATG